MAAKISFVLTGFSSLKRFADPQEVIRHPGLYQELSSGLVKGVQIQNVLHDVGIELVMLAEHSYAFRRMDGLEQTSQLLLSLPQSLGYETVGRYYQTLRNQEFGRGDINQASRSFEYLAENAPSTYRARAMQSLAANFIRRGDLESALSLYREASRFASRSKIHDVYATLGSQKMAAVINGLEGNHRGAVALLENLLPLVNCLRSSQPHVYYDYLNSLAVELCEVGRLEEARNISRVVLASPFAPAYLEWRETSEEIEVRRQRSEVRSRRSEVRRQRSETSRQEAGGRRQTSEIRGQRTPVRGQKSENIVALSAARRDASVTALQEAPTTPARILKFPSGSSFTSEELSEKQKFVQDNLYEIFMAMCQRRAVHPDLLDKLYMLFLVERKPA